MSKLRKVSKVQGLEQGSSSNQKKTFLCSKYFSNLEIQSLCDRIKVRALEVKVQTIKKGSSSAQRKVQVIEKVSSSDRTHEQHFFLKFGNFRFDKAQGFFFA